MTKAPFFHLNGSYESEGTNQHKLTLKNTASFNKNWRKRDTNLEKPGNIFVPSFYRNLYQR